MGERTEENLSIMRERRKENPGIPATAYWKSEWVKNRHTMAARVFWMIPLLSMLLALTFCGLNARYYQMNQFNWWYTTLLPLLLLLCVTSLGKRERAVKNRAIGVLPVNLKKVWAVKVGYCAGILTLSCVIIFAAEEVVSRFLPGEGVRAISGKAAFTGAILMVLLSLWQIPFWLFLELKMKNVVVLVLGLAANTVAGIGGALHTWWLCDPFSYVNRVMCPVLKILPNGLPAEPGNQGYFEGVLDGTVIWQGVFCAAVLFFVLFFATMRWYERRGREGWER